MNNTNRKIYTQADLAKLKEDYISFEFGENGTLEVTTRVDNPTYLSDTRTDVMGYHESFKLRRANNMPCLRSVIVKALVNGVHPLEMMAQLHNYGARTKMFITQKNLDRVMAVVDILLKDEADCNLEERIVKLQATIE